VPLDRAGNPAGARWVAEARADPPAATVRPVDRNSPYTALLVADDLVALELAARAPGLVEQLVAEVGRQAGPTPLIRCSPGATGLFYRGRPPHGSLGGGGWQDDEGCSAGALVIAAGHAVPIELDRGSDRLFEWPRGRPDEVGLEALPELGDAEAIRAAVEAVLRQAGYRPPKSVFDEIEIEEILPAGGAGKQPGGGKAGAEPRGPLGPEPPPLEPPDGPPPEILIRAGERHLASNAGLAALYRLKTTEFYDRGAELVRVVRARGKDARGRTLVVPALKMVPISGLARALNESAQWFRPLPKGGRYRVDVPKPIVEEIASMADVWQFRPVVAIQRTPTLRPDGSLLDKPGYDERAALLCDFGDLRLPHIPARPSRREAETALALLMRTYGNFPFCGAQDQATAIAAHLTACLRPAFPVAPGFSISSPTPGTGKSYLTDCICAAATGNVAAVIAYASKEEENEKRLVGAALAGRSVIVIDNVRRLLEGDFICQVTERSLLTLRPLGTSEVYEVQNRFLLIVNGNNLVAAGDLVRRLLSCNMDANVERPALRQFDSNPLREIFEHRGDFIAAPLMIARYYIEAGRPNSRPKLGSFEEWSDLVRSAICHLGVADPVLSQETLVDDDPLAQKRLAVFSAWSNLKTLSLHDACGLRVRELILEADHDEDLREALVGVAEGQGGGAGKIDHSRLVLWLRRNQNTIAGGFKLVVDRSDASRPRWQLEAVSEP
jgi:putative DNA primase/helicase